MYGAGRRIKAFSSPPSWVADPGDCWGLVWRSRFRGVGMGVGIPAGGWRVVGPARLADMHPCLISKTETLLSLDSEDLFLLICPFSFSFFGKVCRGIYRSSLAVIFMLAQ